MGHEALANLESKLGDRFLLATRNVDGLHRDAGNERLVEMHGNLFRSRCAMCEHGPVEDRTAYAEGEVPGCGACQKRGEFGLLRPHIVWFGEALDPADLIRIEAFMRNAAKGRWVFLASAAVVASRCVADEIRPCAKRGRWLIRVRGNLVHFGAGAQS